MPDYSFPLLKPREIQEIFTELNIPIVEDDLTNPAGWKVKQRMHNKRTPVYLSQTDTARLLPLTCVTQQRWVLARVTA